MEVRAGRYGQAVAGRELPVPMLRVAIVVAVTNFEGGEASLRQTRNQRVHPRQPGMCEGHDAPGAPDNVDDFIRSGADPRDVGRAAVPQQPVERVVAIARMPGGNQRVGEKRASDAAPCCSAGVLEQPFDIDRETERTQPLCDLAQAPKPIGALPLQEPGEAWRVVIEEIREQVDVPLILHARDLHAWDEPQPKRGRRDAGFGNPAERVVIGDAYGGEAGARRSRDEFGGCQRAV